MGLTGGGGGGVSLNWVWRGKLEGGGRKLGVRRGCSYKNSEMKCGPETLRT